MQNLIRYCGLVIALALSACSTVRHREDLAKLDLGTRPLAVNNQVPFIEQTPKLCGPTALYMVMKHYKPEVSLAELTEATMSPGANGTFKQDFLAAARRFGMAPYQVLTPYEIIDQLSEGNPVVLFQSTAILWKDYWHYSVVTGYDMRKENFILHIGPYAYYEMDMSKLLGSWDQGGDWAYVILPPGRLPKFATREESVGNALAFLRLGLLQEASATARSALQRWPGNYESEVILADILLRQDERREAYQHLRRAAAIHPENSILRQKLSELRKLVSSR